jgi:hypothetical protein
MNLPTLYVRIGPEPAKDLEAALADWKNRAITNLTCLDETDQQLAMQTVEEQARLLLQLHSPTSGEVTASLKTPTVCCKFILQSD